MDRAPATSPGRSRTPVPASNAGAPGLSEADRAGLTNWLKATDKGHWEMNPETGIARRTEPLASAEVDTCAACHSRRRVIAKDAVPGTPFLDSYAPAYLEPGLYHADGQIDGEVFEYGSFVQSRMFQAGVTCSNCHEPHSLELRAEGNGAVQPMPPAGEVRHGRAPPSPAGQRRRAVRRLSHADEDLHGRGSQARSQLSSSAAGSVGVDRHAECVHSVPYRSPGGLGRTCNRWVVSAGPADTPHYGAALHAGRTGAVDAEQRLDQLILDRSQPEMARASALLLLPRYATPASEAAIKAAIADPSALVRSAVPRALPPSPPQTVIKAITPMLRDPVRAVRIEAARALAGADPNAMTQDQRTAFDDAYRELVAAEMVDADRPEAHLNLGLLAQRRRQTTAADNEYRTALRLDPNFVPALANLADLDRMRGQDQQGAELLRKAVAIEPNNADVRHSLGLLLVRQHNYAEALNQLRQATELAPDNARYAYVYAIALNSTGAAAEAMGLLERTNRRHPTDPDVLVALVSIARGRGDIATALRYARELAGLHPTDMQLRATVLDLEATVPIAPLLAGSPAREM